METIITPHSTQNISFKDIWEFRELLYFLAWRDIKVRYKQTILGIMWVILQPLLTVIVFNFFFTKVIGISTGNIPYPLFVFSGLLIWNYFSSALSDTSNSFITNQSIITKVFFPRIIIPLSTTIVPVVDFCISFLFFMIILFVFRLSFPVVNILWVLPLLLCSLMTVLGLGSFFAMLNVKYRDIRYVLPYFIQLFLFITPVIYDINKVPITLRYFLYINPLTGIIDQTRAAFFQNYTVNLYGVLISIFSSIGLVFIGTIFFSKYEKDLVDKL